MPSLQYMKSVVEEHHQKRNDLGAFRLPTLETVIAAETMVRILTDINYENTMAVCVVELLSRVANRNTTTFIVSFSGYHPDLWINKKTANDMLASNLQRFSDEGLLSPRYILTNEMDRTYFPLHTETSQYLMKNLRPDILIQPLKETEFREAITQFWGIFQGMAQIPGGEVGEFSYDYRKNVSLKKVFGMLCASFVALRFGLIANGDIEKVVSSAVRFIRELKQHVHIHKWKVLGNVLDHCMRYDQSILKPSTIKDDKTLQSAVTGMWRGAGQGPFGLYCAEPKAYFYTRNAELVPTVTRVDGVRQETLTCSNRPVCSC